MNGVRQTWLVAAREIRERGLIEGRSPDDETAAFLMTMVLFFSISTYGAMVLSGVIEEKSSRTVEVLLARMPARHLLAGKIAGIGMLGLVQIAATAIVALFAASLADSFDVPAVRGSVVAWAVVWFVLGYALYATVFGTLGSLPAVPSTKREARTQLVLIVIATAIGAVVFALSGDFVIGVGVGAGGFAVARQAIKAWGRKGDDQARAENEPDREPVHR